MRWPAACTCSWRSLETGETGDVSAGGGAEPHPTVSPGQWPHSPTFCAPKQSSRWQAQCLSPRPRLPLPERREPRTITCTLTDQGPASCHPWGTRGASPVLLGVCVAEASTRRSISLQGYPLTGSVGASCGWPGWAGISRHRLLASWGYAGGWGRNPKRDAELSSLVPRPGGPTNLVTGQGLSPGCRPFTLGEFRPRVWSPRPLSPPTHIHTRSHRAGSNPSGHSPGFQDRT